MSDTGTDLFLSYNRADSSEVHDIREALARTGISTFFDAADLPVGEPWFDELEKALNDAAGVAVFLGGSGLGTIQSREVQFALNVQAARQVMGRSYPVIPILLEGADPDRVSGFLALNTWVDLRGSKDERAIRKIFQTLQQEKQTTSEELVCPFRSLAAFREEDAALFFGREVFSERLFDAVKDQSFVAVVGSSGSGKSSVVQAGLLPRLRTQRPPAPTWAQIVCTPGSRPFRNLATQLHRSWASPDISPIVAVQESAAVAGALEEGTLTLAECCREALTRTEHCDRLLVVVDQFEELFTLTARPGERQAFVQQLVDVSNDAPVTVVVTLRADFFGHAIGTDRNLSDAIQRGIVTLGPMRHPELRSAIEQPARKTGIEFEAGLVERILTDAGEEAGNLPLLEFALSELWRVRNDRVLTHQAYESIGRVQGAVTLRAENHLSTLSSKAQDQAMAMLVRLVRIPSSTEIVPETRQVSLFSELPTECHRLVRDFAEARLLVMGSSEETGEPTVQVAHEALIRGWQRLRDWIERDREFLSWRQRLRLFCSEWDRSERKDAALLTGSSRREAMKWLRDRPGDLNEEEREFIKACAKRGPAELRGLYLSSIALSALYAFFLYFVAFDEVSETGLVFLSPLWVIGVIFGFYGLSFGKNSLRTSIVVAVSAGLLLYFFFIAIFPSL